MPAEGFPGVARIIVQGHLTPSNTPLRVYSVFFQCTTTPANIVLGNGNGTQITTATALPYVVVQNDTSMDGSGSWDSSMGLRFPNGVFVQTSTSFSFATVVYETEF